MKVCEKKENQIATEISFSSFLEQPTDDRSHFIIKKTKIYVVTSYSTPFRQGQTNAHVRDKSKVRTVVCKGKDNLLTNRGPKAGMDGGESERWVQADKSAKTVGSNVWVIETQNTESL